LVLAPAAAIVLLLLLPLGLSIFICRRYRLFRFLLFFIFSLREVDVGKDVVEELLLRGLSFACVVVVVEAREKSAKGGQWLVAAASIEEINQPLSPPLAAPFLRLLLLPPLLDEHGCLPGPQVSGQIGSSGPPWRCLTTNAAARPSSKKHGK